IIQPFILRRSKRDVEKQLTKKYEHVLKCRLSNRQKMMYEDVILQPDSQNSSASFAFWELKSTSLNVARFSDP
ncbi:E1A-binding protein, partial [Ophiophagus hannah]